MELPRVVPVAGHPVAPRPDALRLRTLAVQPRRPLEGCAELGGPQHRLRRHAREVRALAADEPGLDKRDLRLVVEPAEGADEVLAGRPSTEDDDLHYFRPFAERNWLAMSFGVFLSTTYALFIACIAASVNLAETALAVLARSAPFDPESKLFFSTGATFWNPKMRLLSTSAVYLLCWSCCGSVENPSPPVALFWSSSV